MDTSTGSRSTTPHTTPVSSLRYPRTALYRWAPKVRAAPLHTGNGASPPRRSLNVCSSAGKAELPDPKVLTERFFRRETFRPDPQGSNLMFVFMAQHFTHQFFKTDFKAEGGFTKALGHGVRRHVQPQPSLRYHQAINSVYLLGTRRWPLMCLTLTLLTN